MILSNREFADALDAGDIVIDPLERHDPSTPPVQHDGDRSDARFYDNDSPPVAG